MTTHASKKGEGCSTEDTTFQRYGTSWIRDNRIMFTGNFTVPSFLAEFFETPFFFDADDDKKDRLFIKDRSTGQDRIVKDRYGNKARIAGKSCWIVYERAADKAKELME